MFCVVQTLWRKKPDPHGAYRAYEVSSMTLQFPDGTSKTHYSYYPDYEKGRFERDHRECYKISVHESRREGGKVVKKQCVIATIDYYTLAAWGLLYDYIDSGVKRAAETFGADYDAIYQLVENKMQPIIDRIQKEFRKTEEYKSEKQREKIQKAYQRAKKQFSKKYDVPPDEYDCIYNVFGELMDENYLNQIIRQYEQKQEAQRRYQERQSGNYRQYTYSGRSSYCATPTSTYTSEEKVLLKEFYRTLSKKFHPDLNRDRDTTEVMKLINRLKADWGI